MSPPIRRGGPQATSSELGSATDHTTNEDFTTDRRQGSLIAGGAQ
jgi:hypothetical protein